jgi:hypothetical protein
VLVSWSLSSFSVLFLLDTHTFFLWKLGSGHRAIVFLLFFYDLLLSLLESVIGEILWTFTVNGGRFSLVFAHKCWRTDLKILNLENSKST